MDRHIRVVVGLHSPVAPGEDRENVRDLNRNFDRSSQAEEPHTVVVGAETDRNHVGAEPVTSLEAVSKGIGLSVGCDALTWPWGGYC